MFNWQNLPFADGALINLVKEYYLSSYFVFCITQGDSSNYYEYIPHTRKIRKSTFLTAKSDSHVFCKLNESIIMLRDNPFSLVIKTAGYTQIYNLNFNWNIGPFLPPCCYYKNNIFTVNNRIFLILSSMNNHLLEIVKNRMYPLPFCSSFDKVNHHYSSIITVNNHVYTVVNDYYSANNWKKITITENNQVKCSNLSPLLFNCINPGLYYYKGYIYAFGGEFNLLTRLCYLTTCQKYCIDTNQWEEIASMSTAKTKCTCFLDQRIDNQKKRKSCIHVIGGLNCKVAPEELYDIELNQWFSPPVVLIKEGALFKGGVEIK